MKVSQIQTLVESHWIAIDRSKRGSANHKAFLTREGRVLVDERKKDFEFVKQSIGHRRMDTTSSYVKKLSDQERQEPTFQLK